MSLLNKLSAIFEKQQIRAISQPGLNREIDVVRHIAPMVNDAILGWSIPIVMDEEAASDRTKARALKTLEGDTRRAKMATRITRRLVRKLRAGMEQPMN